MVTRVRRDVRRQAGDDHARTHQARCVDRLHQVVGHRGVDGRHTGDVDDDHLGAVGADRPQQLLGDLAGALAVQHADDRQDQQLFAHLQHGRGQLADGLLLLADDALALLHEADGHGVGDAVGRRLVGVEHPVQQVEVGLVLLEQRPGEHVAQQQHDAEHLVGLHAPGDDAFRQVARVGLQRLDATGLEHLDVVVVHRGRLGEQLLRRHRRQQFRLGDPAGPLLTQGSPVLPQMLDELGQQTFAGESRRLGALDTKSIDDSDIRPPTPLVLREMARVLCRH